jgi:type II secretory pathway pseudopilin PulG
VLAVLVVFSILAAVAAAGAAALGRSRRFNEVDRFHRASRMTTEWARAGVTKPVIADQHQPQDERERSDA